MAEGQKLLDLIQKLMRLATNNPHPEEASAAALKAVQLILENKVTLTLPQSQAPPATKDSISYEDVVEVYKQAAKEADRYSSRYQSRSSWDYVPNWQPHRTPYSSAYRWDGPTPGMTEAQIRSICFDIGMPAADIERMVARAKREGRL